MGQKNRISEIADPGRPFVRGCIDYPKEDLGIWRKKLPPPLSVSNSETKGKFSRVF
jgi:hypothetical protein